MRDLEKILKMNEESHWRKERPTPDSEKSFLYAPRKSQISSRKIYFFFIVFIDCAIK